MRDIEKYTRDMIFQRQRPFTNGSSDHIKLSKTQLHEIGQTEGFLDDLIRPLLKTGLPLMKNVLKP